MTASPLRKNRTGRRGRYLTTPRTPAGWWSVAWISVFFTGLAALNTMIRVGERGGDTFFANPQLAFAGLLALSGALVAALAALVAVWRQGERSLVVWVTLLLGTLVLLFVLGEILVPHG